MQFAQFLEIMNKDLMNEWTHLGFYLYHSSAATGLHAEEYKEFLTKAAESELQHVQQFMDRLWGFKYLQPCQAGHGFATFTNIENILAYATDLERTVADNYAARLEQIDTITDASATAKAYLKVFYEDQLQDSYEDCEKMRRILANLVSRSRAAE